MLLIVSFICCTPLIEKVWDVLRRRSWSRVLTVGVLLLVILDGLCGGQHQQPPSCTLTFKPQRGTYLDFLFDKIFLSVSGLYARAVQPGRM